MQTTKEIWKDIPNFEGRYQASNHGQIRSLIKTPENPIILKETTNIHGYKFVSICGVDKIRTIAVHRLVIAAFVGIDPKLVTDHINSDRGDNRLSNLRQITQRENIGVKKKHHTSKYIGVSFNKQMKKWSSYIWWDRKLNHLGYFMLEIEAHEAYKKALKEYNNLKNKPKSSVHKPNVKLFSKQYV